MSYELEFALILTVTVVLSGFMIWFFWRLFLYWLNYKYTLEYKDHTTVDDAKMNRDVAHGVSQAEIRRRYVNGYYDKNR